MTNWYICVKPGTLEIVDRFWGTEEDKKLRSQDLEFIKLNSNLNPSAIYVSRDENGSVSVHEDTEKKEQLENNKKIQFIENLRTKRDSELRRTDWIVSVSDSPLSTEKIEEWKVYRQALRDIPANTTDLENPVWPTPPE